MAISEADAVRFVYLLTAIGLSISTLEILWVGRFAGSTALIAIRSRIDLSRDFTSRGLVRTLARPFGFLTAATIRGCFAVYALIYSLLDYPGEMYAFSIVPITALSLYISWYRIVGEDGADQMRLLTSVALSLGVLTDSMTYALMFIAGQTLLAYFTAGLAKLSSLHWRSGNALQNIVSTVNYGSPRFRKSVLRWPLIGKLLTWATIAFECAAPLVLLDERVTELYVATAVVFHVSAAVIMGLNQFVWAFGAGLIAVTFASEEIAIAKVL